MPFEMDMGAIVVPFGVDLGSIRDCLGKFDFTSFRPAKWRQSDKALKVQVFSKYVNNPSQVPQKYSN